MARQPGSAVAPFAPGQIFDPSGDPPEERPRNPAQGFENMDSTPGIATASASLGQTEMARQPGSAVARFALGQIFDASGDLLESRLENSPQAIETADSAPEQREQSASRERGEGRFAAVQFAPTGARTLGLPDAHARRRALLGAG
jgi:hypothetical protein